MAQKVVSQIREKIAAATIIQAAYRRHAAQRWYLGVRATIVRLQARVRGVLVRRRVKLMLARRASSDSASSNKDYSELVPFSVFSLSDVATVR